ncbi:2-amino-4-hydroxy-6-hydroxymethyldihydropteridine diphosphokinase [Methylocapsa acidiphila]|uniref:2-amino-4-hydroxy-6- hydroxymethyldihydropteridine diphosphokinase n=1 Tax=Methylocapsa acidiphila TaxID=133552 RepID=UPI000413EBE1|nr:2-amino-4-hydroxy-6-hydroxymethyldihydropteridine diphosphokinase [Methylocapsa acidiphila]
MPSHSPELLGAGQRTQIGLGLGSNIGDKAGNIRRALNLLEERGIVRLTAVSSIYRTAPWGFVEQDFFANACALGETLLEPLELLAATTAIERDMGREPTVRWGPRLIDVDILFHGDASFQHEQLNLPHKDLFNRAFVLIPLAEIAPSLSLSGRSIQEAAAGFAAEPIEKWSIDESGTQSAGES